MKTFKYPGDPGVYPGDPGDPGDPGVYTPTKNQKLFWLKSFFQRLQKLVSIFQRLMFSW